MRHQGKISNWKDEQGFGFISPNVGAKQVFVHIKSFSNRQRRPQLNEIVTYVLNTDAKGRVFADDVAFIDKRVPQSNFSGYDNFLLALAVVFMFLLFLAVLFSILPSYALGLSFVLSMVTFGTYAMDKSAARKGRWRTKEKTLHLFALFGGWPGAIVAQRLLRHKSKKLSFQIYFWLTVAFNCVALGWLSMISGYKFSPFCCWTYLKLIFQT